LTNSRQKAKVLAPVLRTVAVAKNGVRLRLLTSDNGRSRKSAM